MQIYPAIDLRNGRCVRLTQGNFDEMNIYSDSPVQTALMWQEQGARYLHLVDLDGAREGQRVNGDQIRAIAKAVRIPVELGGGIRSLRDMEDALNLGVSRVIIGTKAQETPGIMREAVHALGAERVVAGIDAKDGYVALKGWESVSTVTAAELGLRMRDMGVKTIVYTDISRDGTLSGPNVEATQELARTTGLEVILSGGVSSMADLRKLYVAHLPGVIIGKALYEKRIPLAEALKAFS